MNEGNNCTGADLDGGGYSRTRFPSNVDWIWIVQSGKTDFISLYTVLKKR